MADVLDVLDVLDALDALDALDVLAWRVGGLGIAHGCRQGAGR